MEEVGGEEGKMEEEGGRGEDGGRGGGRRKEVKTILLRAERVRAMEEEAFSEKRGEFGVIEGAGFQPSLFPPFLKRISDRVSNKENNRTGDGREERRR